MTWQAWLFLLLPCLSALCVGRAVGRTGMAALVVAVAVGAFLLGAQIGSPLSKLLIPLVTGAGVAALALVPLLAIRPVSGPLSRMAAGLTASLAAHLLYLQLAMAVR